MNGGIYLSVGTIFGFLTIFFLCLGVVGLIESADNEKIEKKVPCYDEYHNRIEGLVCVDKSQPMNDKTLFLMPFIFASVTSAIAFGKYLEEERW